MHENDANRPVLTCKALDARNMWVLGSATTPASQPLLVKITQIADPLSSECGSIFRWLMCYGSDPQVAQQRHCAPSDDFWYIHDGSGFKDGTSIPYLQEPDTGRRMLKSGLGNSCAKIKSQRVNTASMRGTKIVDRSQASWSPSAKPCQKALGSGIALFFLDRAILQ